MNTKQSHNSSQKVQSIKEQTKQKLPQPITVVCEDWIYKMYYSQ